MKENNKIQKQIQIEEEEKKQNKINEDDDLNMHKFLKDLKSMHQRVDNSTAEVQNQDKKIVNVNEKLDDYNDEIDQGDDLNNIVNKGVFSSIFDGIKGLFKSKNKYKINNSNDKKIINDAKNKKNEINEINKENNKINNNDINKLQFKSDGDWEILKKKNIDELNEDEVVEESIKEVNGMTNSVKYFNKNVQDSKKLIDVTNKHFDKTHEHTNKVIKKMEDNC